MNAGKASLGGVAGVVASPAADCRDQANETKLQVREVSLPEYNGSV